MDKLDAVLASLAVACQLLIGAAFLIGSQSDPSSSAAVPTLQAVNRTLEEIQADYVENRHTDCGGDVLQPAASKAILPADVDCASRFLG